MRATMHSVLLPRKEGSKDRSRRGTLLSKSLRLDRPRHALLRDSDASPVGLAPPLTEWLRGAGFPAGTVRFLELSLLRRAAGTPIGGYIS
jgi:hypothetical protein